MSQFLKDRKAIHKWLNKKQITDYKLSDDLIVDVMSDVNLRHQDLTSLPIQFGKIMGSFDISHNQLKSLEGSPHTVAKIFNCSFNQLTNLTFAPHTIFETLNCSNNQIVDLSTFTNKQCEILDCSRNPIVIEKMLHFQIQHFKHECGMENQKIELFKLDYHKNYNAQTLFMPQYDFNDKINALTEKKLLEHSLIQNENLKKTTKFKI